MKLPSNVGRSPFRPNTYVVYDGRGHIWFAIKTGRRWAAAPAANNPARCDGVMMRGDTLAEVAQQAAARTHPRTVEPF